MAEVKERPDISVLTERDMMVCVAMAKWIEVVRKEQADNPWYGKNWLPSGADIQKSRLFWRIRSGKAPLEHAPPRAYSCPWYEVIDEPERAHWAYDYCESEGKAYFAQCGYEVLERDENGLPCLVKFAPYQFKCWSGPSPYGGNVEGWWLQLVQPARPTEGGGHE